MKKNTMNKITDVVLIVLLVMVSTLAYHYKHQVEVSKALVDEVIEDYEDFWDTTGEGDAYYDYHRIVE